MKQAICPIVQCLFDKLTEDQKREFNRLDRKPREREPKVFYRFSIVGSDRQFIMDSKGRIGIING